MSAARNQRDETVNRYIADFQRRYPVFERARKSRGGARARLIHSLFRERVILGDKPNYDARLQEMLTAEEHERLETDPRFTKAWRIFVDTCWLRRQVIRFTILIGGGVLVVGFAVSLAFSLPEWLGTTHP